MIDLFKRFGQQTGQSGVSNNPQVGMIKNAFNMVKGAKNPQNMMNMIMQNNPMYQSVMSYVQQNGGDAQKAFYNFASQNGMSEADANNIINSLH